MEIGTTGWLVLEAETSLNNYLSDASGDRRQIRAVHARLLTGVIASIERHDVDHIHIAAVFIGEGDLGDHSLEGRIDFALDELLLGADAHDVIDRTGEVGFHPVLEPYRIHGHLLGVWPTIPEHYAE